MYALYPTEIMRTGWLQTLDEYWDKEDKTHSDDCSVFPEGLFKYYHGLHLGEYIEGYFLIRKSQHHRMTPKYYIMRSLAPLVKHYL